MKELTKRQKLARANLSKNPNYYKDLAKQRKKPFHHFAWLKQSDPERLKRISKAGGQSRKYEIIPPGTFSH